MFVFHVKTNVNPIVICLFEEQVKSVTNVAVNNACDKVLTTKRLSDIVSYSYDSNGKLELISVNSAMVNKISKELMVESENSIVNLSKGGVNIPLGALSGITILSGKGPKINVDACPAGSIDIDFASDFESVGINHTKHSVYLTVNAVISVVVPGLHHFVQTKTTVLLCENLIIGEVPQGILSGKFFG